VCPLLLCAVASSQSGVLPPCLCASVRAIFSHRGTETQSSWSIRVPFTSLQTLIVAAQRSGLLPSCLSRPARRPKGCAPQLLPIHGSSSVPLCLRESKFFFSQRHGDTEFRVIAYAAHVPAETHCRGPQVWITPQLLIPRGGRTKGVSPLLSPVASSQSGVLPPRLCASVRAIFSHRGTETQSSWSIRVPFTSLQTLTVAAHSSGSLPSCLSYAAEERRVYPRCLAQLPRRNPAFFLRAFVPP
jgi:hypothetical protein